MKTDKNSTHHGWKFILFVMAATIVAIAVPFMIVALIILIGGVPSPN